MDTFDSSTHSFLIRLWVVEQAGGNGHVTWRGQIIHIPSGRRQTLQDLTEIVPFLAPYLAEMGVEVGLSARVKLWLRRLKPISRA